MEFDNPGAAEPWSGEGNRSPHSEFSGSEASADKRLKKDKTIILGAKSKKDKEKKKEKETRYAHLGDESSEDEEARLKKAKKKGFQFGSAKKEKKEKKEKVPEVKDPKEGRKKEKKEKEKEKEKSRLKLKKSKLPDVEPEGEQIVIFVYKSEFIESGRNPGSDLGPVLYTSGFKYSAKVQTLLYI
jgi:hypothetical protein